MQPKRAVQADEGPIQRLPFCVKDKDNENEDKDKEKEHKANGFK